jgi:hypothetical protein
MNDSCIRVSITSIAVKYTFSSYSSRKQNNQNGEAAAGNHSNVPCVHVRAINEPLEAHAYTGGQKILQHSREGFPNLSGFSSRLAAV